MSWVSKREPRRCRWVARTKPLGKVDTNVLVCALAVLAMNILRLMGRRGLLGLDAPVRYPAKLRRVKTVM